VVTEPPTDRGRSERPDVRSATESPKGATTVGVIGAEPWGSVGHLFRTIAAVLGDRFTVEVSAQDRGAHPAQLERCDVLVGRTGAHLALRDRLGIARPMIYLPLGELPLGVGYIGALARTLRSYDTIAFSCEGDRGVFDRQIARCRARSVVMPYFVDVEHMAPTPPARRAAIRRELGFAQGDVVFAYVGRVRSDKNVQAILRAFAYAARKAPAIRLMIVGAVGESPSDLWPRPAWDMASVIGGLIDLYGLGDRVTLIGEVDHARLPVLYGAADVSINLTLHETENFGFAQAEASACGVPVIGSRWGGLKDVIEHGTTGFGADTWLTGWGVHVDRGQVVDAMVRLATDGALRVAMGKAARRRAVERFSLETFTANLDREIDDCLRRVAAGDDGAPAALAPLGERLARRTGMFDRRSYATYAEMIEPYCSRRVGDAPPAGARYFTAPLQLELGKRVRADDLLWPGTYTLDPGPRRALAAMIEHEAEAPTMSLRQLATATRRKRIEPVVAELLGRGLIVPSLPLEP
jgi:glycosyltransferase involved in cell wall biosynthesis